MNRHQLMFYTAFLWLCMLSATIIYMYWKIYDDSTLTQPQKTTTTSLVHTVQDLTVQVDTLNTTATKTAQSLSIGFDGKDVYAFLNIQGTDILTGYIYSDNKTSVNITSIFSNETVSTCNCSDKIFYEFTVNSAGCCDRVFLSQDLSTVCLLSLLSVPQEICSSLTILCRYITIFNLDWADGFHKNIATLYMSYKDACV